MLFLSILNCFSSFHFKNFSFFRFKNKFACLWEGVGLVLKNCVITVKKLGEPTYYSFGLNLRGRVVLDHVAFRHQKRPQLPDLPVNLAVRDLHTKAKVQIFKIR